MLYIYIYVIYICGEFFVASYIDRQCCIVTGGFI